MYIGITVDMKNYTGEVFDLRISNFLTIKKVIDICWQIKRIEECPADGYWIRVINKEKVCSGYASLIDSGITNGDRIEIL
ncbi:MULTISPECIES: EsaB/YukD family protein [Bacillus]|uniref:EsaB/YukD family protein n=1 Tax=Bacillus TaxID=1386 RepID=UPI000302C63E|nr:MULTISPECIES: EsaB/YukD family protein [Bacillus]